LKSQEAVPLKDVVLPEISLCDLSVLLDDLAEARELVVPVLPHQLRHPVAGTASRAGNELKGTLLQKRELFVKKKSYHRIICFMTQFYTFYLQKKNLND